jgi:hypothetical protein
MSGTLGVYEGSEDREWKIEDGRKDLRLARALHSRQAAFDEILLFDILMELDFATGLNLISTLTVIGAVIFAGLQVRSANRMRRDQAAIAMIQSAQSETWSRAANLIRSGRQMEKGVTLKIWSRRWRSLL